MPSSTSSTNLFSPLFLARAVYLRSLWITSSLASSTAPNIEHYLPLLTLTLTAMAAVHCCRRPPYLTVLRLLHSMNEQLFKLHGSTMMAKYRPVQVPSFTHQFYFTRNLFSVYKMFRNRLLWFCLSEWCGRKMTQNKVLRFETAGSHGSCGNHGNCNSD